MILPVPNLGDLIPASFAVPQNPLRPGMGDLSSDFADATAPIASWLQSSTVISGVQNSTIAFGVGGLALALILFLPSGSEYRRKRAALRSQYRGYRRVARSASSGLQGL
jgi:hypothetical protein